MSGEFDWRVQPKVRPWWEEVGRRGIFRLLKKNQGLLTPDLTLPHQ